MIAQAFNSQLDAGVSFSKLTRNDQYLIRKVRKGLLKRDVTIVPDDWRNGNGVLTGAECMYRDLGKRPSESHGLYRRDKNQPHSASNSFWLVEGHRNFRPVDAPDIAMECGDRISLSMASKLSGLSVDCIRNRLRKITIEQVMLTPKSCRFTYPKERAFQFFQVNHISECDSRLIQDEQESYLAEVGKAGRKETRNFSALTVLSNNKLMSKVTQVLELDLSATKKTSLLAFLACPTTVRLNTNGVLSNIIRRCRDKDDPNYHHYGGRGIDVCETWVSGIGKMPGLYCFVLDVGPQQPAMELDRIDNDAGYNKLNCRWVTRKDNMKNTFRAEDIAARLNALVEQAVRIELQAREEAKEEKVDMDDFLKSIL